VPITIISPLAEQPIGPGVHVQASTSLPSIPADWHWTANVFTPDFNQQVGFAAVRSAPQIVSLFIGLDESATGISTPVWAPQVASLDVENHVALSVALRDVNHQIMEETVRTVTWEPNPAGVAYVQSFSVAQTGGGLTPTQAEHLEFTMAYAAMGLGGFVPGLPDALGALLPLGYTFEQITPDRTGTGELSRPGGALNTNALGIAWSITFAPVGIGINPGAPPSYDISMLELAKTKRMTGGQVTIDDSLETSDSDRVWIWNLDSPWTMRYAIIPGVVVRFYWVLFSSPIGGGRTVEQLLDELCALRSSQ
jgi:hypothetical protein